MANIKGTQTVNGIWIVNTDTNPTLTGGVDAPIGSWCLAEDGSGFFYKFGASNTDWEQGSSASSISGVNVLLVRKNPSTGQYATIEDAINAITSPPDTNRWLILVGVGQFTENTLVLPNYTSVIGSSIQVTQIFPATSTQHIWELGLYNEISFMWLEGAGSGYSAIHVNDSGNYSQAHKVTFNNNDINVLVESATQDTFFYGEYLDFNGTYSYGLKVIATNGFRAYANVENYYNFPTGGASVANYVTGANSDIHVIAGGCEGYGVGSAFYLQDGANLQLTAFNINNFDKCIHNGNIGSACNVLISGVVAKDIATYDIQIEHPLTNGTIGGAFDDTKISVASSLVGLLIQDTNDGSLLITNKLNVLFNNGTITDVSSLIIEGATMGVEKGGTLSDGGGFVVDILAGNGYFELFPDVDIIKRLDWNNTSITLSANVDVFIYFNNNGTLVSNGAKPDTRFNILLGRVVTNGTGIEFIDASPLIAEHTSNLILNNLTEAIGSIYASGSIVTENATPLNLNVSSGEYYYGANEFIPSGGNGITFTSIYGQGSGVITGQTSVNNTQYDNAGTLTSLTAGYYAKGSLYLVGDGANEKYYFVFAQAEYSTLLAVQQADIPLPPNSFTGSVVLIAGIIIQEGNPNIVQIIDQRPIIGFRAFGVTASSDHLSLLNLNGGINGDGGHTNMFTIDGSKAMTGNMNMGTNNIFNAGTFNSVVVESHASRHLPNGADPLTTAAPTTNLSGTSLNGVGIQNSFSRSDHSHAISGAALTRVNDTNVTLTLGGSPNTALLNAASLTLGWTGTLSELRGGTNQSTYTEGDILYASASNTLSKLPIGSGGSFLRSSGTTVSWSTTTFPNSAATGDLIYASSLNNFSTLSVGTDGQVLKVVAGVPSWQTDTATGTVTTVSVVTSQGVSGVVANPTTTPAITLTLGALTGVTSFNGLVITANTGVITTGTWNGALISTQYGGTGANNSTNTSGSFLRSNGLNGNYVASTLTLPDSATTGDILIATGTNVIGSLSDVAVGRVLISGGVGVIPSYSASPILGVAGTLAGTIGLSGATSGVVTIQTAAAAGTWDMTLPTSAGINGQYLTTNGSGVLSWTAPTSKTIWTSTSTVALGSSTGTALGAGVGSLVIAANTLTSGKVIRVTLRGNLTLTGTNKNLTLQVKVGSVVVTSNAFVTLGTSTSIVLTADINVYTAGAIGVSSIVGNSWCIIGGTVSGTANSAISTIDTTVNNTLDINVAANTLNSLNITNVSFELLN